MLSYIEKLNSLFWQVANTRWLSLLLLLVLSVSVLKHLSYPLLWNDESETIMHAKRVTEYGYPKVSDGKNKVYPILLPQHPDIAIDESSDAYLGLTWAMFYYGAISVKLAELSDDLYVKTFLCRLPFALLGLVGLLLLLHVLNVLRKQNVFAEWNIYLFLIILSVPTALHIREVRYYALVPGVEALFFWVFLRFLFNPNLKRGVMVALVIGLSYQVFPVLLPVNTAFAGAAIAYQLLLYRWEYGQWNKALLRFGALSLGVTMLITLPMLLYFKAFAMTAATSEFNYFSIEEFKKHILETLHYLWEFESLPLLTFTVGVFIVLALFKRSVLFTTSARMVMLFCGFLLIHFVFSNRVPATVYFRYFIPIPFTMALATALCFVLVYKSLPKSTFQLAFMSVFLLLAAHKVLKVKDVLKGHLYELTHQYKGVLDYTIPLIKEEYGETSDLIIATNYEECSYMFYLDSKVTYGYVGNNLAQDSVVTPDVIIHRKNWWHPKNLFDRHIEHQDYQEFLLPVYDYPVNNIPDIYSHHAHLFRTRGCPVPMNCATVLIAK